MLKETLARNIREARIEKGITQKELADAVGVHQNIVSRWETGRAAPELGNIEALSKLLDKPAEHFFRTNHEKCVKVPVSFWKQVETYWPGLQLAHPAMEPLPSQLELCENLESRSPAPDGHLTAELAHFAELFGKVA